MSAEEELAYLRTLVQQLQKENGELKARLEAAPGAAGPGAPGTGAQRTAPWSDTTPVETLTMTDF